MATSNQRLSLSFLLSIAMVLLLTQISYAGDNDTIKKVSREAHHELLEGEYIPVNQAEMKKTTAYRSSGSGFYTIQVNTSEDGENIVGDAANEPSIAIDPTNPDKMVIGWRQFNTIQNSFRQAGYAVTTDGADSWTAGIIDEGVFRSDPVLDSDAEGNIYYNSLTVEGNNYFCDVFRMEAGYTDWDEKVYALGGDKQWMVIDKTDGIGSGHIYASWNSSYSICYPDFFTRSVDAGVSYEDCTMIPGDSYWGTLAVGADGTLYTAGYSNYGFIVVKSTTAHNPDWPVTWDPFTEVYMDGFISSRTGPNPGGLLGQVWIDVDRSDGEYSGNVYLLCSVERYNNYDPLDVMISRSTDGGITWEETVRVNQDISNTNWQWFGTMSVAPDGRIDVVWLDTRNGAPGSYESALFYAFSIDGGETFSQNEQVSDYFDPHTGWPQQDKMGDYYHMISDLDYAHLAWSNTLNGEQDVYYTRINPWFVGVDENELKKSIVVSVFPNPTENLVSIRYELSEQSDVNYRIYNIHGKEVLAKYNLQGNYGLNSTKIDVGHLPGGVYHLKLDAGGRESTTKLVIQQ